MNSLTGSVGSIRSTTFYLMESHQFQAAGRGSQEHIFASFWQISNSFIIFLTAMCQGVVIDDTGYHGIVSFRLIGPQIGVEVARVVVKIL